VKGLGRDLLALPLSGQALSPKLADSRSVSDGEPQGHSARSVQFPRLGALTRLAASVTGRAAARSFSSFFRGRALLQCFETNDQGAAHRAALRGTGDECGGRCGSMHAQQTALLGAARLRLLRHRAEDIARPHEIARSLLRVVLS
jgi:hypothetical protein